MIKIIHTADIHLDSDFRMEDKQKETARQSELRAAFSSLMFWAKSEEADVMLIAGDLFDSPHPTPETVEFALSQFAANPKCHFVIAPGEHDYIASDSVYEKTKFPENLHIFRSPRFSCLHLGEMKGLDVKVYGYAFTAPIMNMNPFEGFTAEKSDSLNLFCGHGTVGKESKVCPITLESIRDSALDYMAFGHMHGTPGVKKVKDTYFGYAGSLEPRSFRDLGERGAFLIEADKKNGIFTCRPTFFRLAKRVYATDTVDLSACRNQEDILEKITLLLKNRGYGKDTLLRLTLEGSLAAEIDIPYTKLEALTAQLYHCELRDHTFPAFDLEALQKDPTVKGEMARALATMLESEKEEEKKIASRAYLATGCSGFARTPFFFLMPITPSLTSMQEKKRRFAKPFAPLAFPMPRDSIPFITVPTIPFGSNLNGARSKKVSSSSAASRILPRVQASRSPLTR